jgi:hypothetical protein
MYVEGSYDVIADNVIYNQPYGFGIQLYPANHDTVVVDNTILRNHQGGIVVGGRRGVDAMDLDLEHASRSRVRDVERTGQRTGAAELLDDVVDVHPARSARLGDPAQRVGCLDEEPLAGCHLGERFGGGIEEQRRVRAREAPHHPP